MCIGLRNSLAKYVSVYLYFAQSLQREENVQALEEVDLKSPICTIPDDFKSFEKWASKSQFKTVVETYELAIRPLLVREFLTHVQLGQRGL